MKKEFIAFLHRSKQSYETEYKYLIYPCDMSEYGYTFLAENVVHFNLPTESLMLNKEIEMLNKKAQKIKADAFVEVDRINEKIQSLLAIEDKG